LTAGRRDVLVVGDLNPDVIVAGGEDAPQAAQGERDADVALVLGGSAGICAAGLARLGASTAICAAVGDDDLGTAVRRMAGERGVGTDAVRVLPGVRTGVSVHVLAGDDRVIYTDRGAIAQLDVDDAIAWLDPAPRHVHLASVYLMPGLVAEGGRLVEAAHAAGATVSVDTNFDPTERFERPPWLTRADVLLPNATEALAFARGDDVEAAARELAADGALVAVKQGARGAFAVSGGERAEVRVPPGSEPVDAVGAGDAFDAGLIRALLDGVALPDALAFACACGTLSTRAAGGVAGQATLEEARGLVREWVAWR
jgi:sugar/nucleoside kinase (ribokinase family)